MIIIMEDGDSELIISASNVMVTYFDRKMQNKSLNNHISSCLVSVTTKL